MFKAKMNKRLYIYAVIIVAAVCLIVLIYDIVSESYTERLLEPPSGSYSSSDVSGEVVNRRYTPPDTYELVYRITYTNGLTVKIIRSVSREKYEKILEDNN